MLVKDVHGKLCKRVEKTLNTGLYPIRGLLNSSMVLELSIIYQNHLYL